MQALRTLARETLSTEIRMIREPRTRAKRSVLGPICAIAWLTLCLALAPTSCLNPFPDDQPSSKDNDSPAALAPGSKEPNVEGGTPGVSAPTGGVGAGGEFDLPDNSPASSPVPPGEGDAGVPSGDAGPDAQAAVAR
jgi:hypothetical protein